MSVPEPDTRVWRCVVPGQPVPKARARVYVTRSGKVRAVTPQRTKNAEEAIGWELKLVWRQEADASARYAVHCRFVFPLTKGGRERRVDGDNCLKAVLDAGNGVVWADDAQVRETSARVAFGDEPRTEITWWAIERILTRPGAPRVEVQ